jgi:hypothetical protein
MIKNRLDQSYTEKVYRKQETGQKQSILSKSNKKGLPSL